MWTKEEEKIMDAIINIWLKKERMTCPCVTFNMSQNSSDGEKTLEAFKKIVEFRKDIKSCQIVEHDVTKTNLKSFSRDFNFVRPVIFPCIHL